MDIQVFDNPSTLADEAAPFLAAMLTGEGRHSLGLAGGSTPMPTYEKLSQINLDWGQVDLWLGDERWVPPDSAQSNARMCRNYLVQENDPIFHEVRFAEDKDPDEAAQAYESILGGVFESTGGRADVVLLGLGDDGHTASLFPGSDAMNETERLYVATYVPQLGMWRLSATIPLLSSARHLVFLISGEGKAEAVRWLVDPRPDDPEVPARIVAREAEIVTVLMDEAASTQIVSRAG